MPSVRREHEFLDGCGQQDSGPPDAANLAGNIRDADHLLPDVRRWGSSSRLRMGGGSEGGLMGLGGIATQVNYRLGASLPLPYNLGQPWRLVTAIFLHGGLLHIGFNMWVLMDIGPMVEEMYGSARYFFLFVASGAFGYLVSSAMGHLSVGASGSLLGLIGVLLAATQGQQSLQAKALRSALIRWLIYIGVLGLCIQRHRQRRAPRWACVGLRAWPVDGRSNPGGSYRAAPRRFAGLGCGDCGGCLFWLHGCELSAKFVTSLQ